MSIHHSEKNKYITAFQLPYLALETVPVSQYPTRHRSAAVQKHAIKCKILDSKNERHKIQDCGTR